ncbi:major histocompatibility complex class I-related gene protein-like [Discoglossus pictus]
MGRRGIQGIREIETLFVLFLLGPGVYSDSHSLRYYFSTIMISHSEDLLYSVVACVDDMPFGKYNSETRHAQPFYKWMEEHVDPKHWEEQTKLGQYFEHFQKIFARVLIRLFNQTHGHADVYTFQVKFACELHEDGTISGYEEYGFNGKEFIVFDKKNLVFVPISQEAQILTQKWNRNKGVPEKHKAYMERDCVTWMKKYFGSGRNRLQRKVPPKVTVSERHSDGVTRLHCHVYGFYPQDVDVKWVKNGIDNVYSEEAKQILPNPDGTYQTRVTVEVKPKKGDSYYCHVDHSSLEEMVITPWEPKRSISHYTWIGIGAAAAAVGTLGLILFGVFIYKLMSDHAIRRQMVNIQEPD